MNPANMARLRALAEAAQKTPVGITSTGRTLFAKGMPVSPAAVLSLLDEVARLREALDLSLQAWATTSVSNGAIREAQAIARADALRQAASLADGEWCCECPNMLDIGEVCCHSPLRVCDTALPSRILALIHPTTTGET